ncbi:MAG: NAD(P)H-quinone oxidoreductase subunit D4, partial [Leptolyngbyaceae bacterium]|nr:NAD(P)H-quinone oxidoreductase subunit D4 [Leptolyngbyaceae bacterium]
MLSILIWLPALGAALVGFWPGALSPKASRLMALAIATLTLLWNLFLFTKFDLNFVSLQMQEYLPWLDALGLTYRLGVDGLSLPLLALNSLLVWIVIYSSNQQLTRPRLFYSLVLLVGSVISGAFLAQNLLLFVLFYEVEL